MKVTLMLAGKSIARKTAVSSRPAFSNAVLGGYVHKEDFEEC